MKVKEITITCTRGLPDYSSISASVSMLVDDESDMSSAWSYARGEVAKQIGLTPNAMERKLTIQNLRDDVVLMRTKASTILSERIDKKKETEGGED